MKYTMIIDEIAESVEDAALQFAESVADMIEQDAVMVVNVLDPDTKTRVVVYTSFPPQVIPAAEYWPEP